MAVFDELDLRRETLDTAYSSKLVRRFYPPR